MSNNSTEAEYWKRVDAFIDVANKQCNPADPNEVGASLLYASARFNAFIVAKTVGTAANMTLEKERALEYFTDQFRKMMLSNLEDFTVNFDKHMKPDA